MAKFDYNEYANVQTTTNQRGKSKVGYFNSLKENGDTAIVRFAYQSPSEFDIVTIHKVQIDGKWRSISCLKGPYDPVDNCPLCKAGNKLNKKIYVKMLEYVRDEQGNIVPKAVVWERPAEGKNDFVKKLMSIIGAGYQDLSKYIFTIRRNGARGSLDTTYDVNPAHPDIYPNNLYPADFSDFKDFDLAHHSYMERPFEDLNTYVTTGTMPAYKKSTTNESVVQPVPQQPVYNQQPQPINQTNTYVNPSVSNTVNNTNVVQPVSNQPTYTNPADGVRPRRTTYEF